MAAPRAVIGEPLLMDVVFSRPRRPQKTHVLLASFVGLGVAGVWLVGKDRQPLDFDVSMAATGAHSLTQQALRQPSTFWNSLHRMRPSQPQERQSSQSWIVKNAPSMRTAVSAETGAGQAPTKEFVPDEFYEVQPFAQFFDFRSLEEKFDSGDMNLAKAFLFSRLKIEGAQLTKQSLVYDAVQKQILNQGSLSEALVAVLSARVASPALSESMLSTLFRKAVEENALDDLMCKDLVEMMRKDPAIRSTVTLPFFFMKGFQAVQLQRISHTLWLKQDFEARVNALALQSRMSEVFGVDLHPGAKIGAGMFLDHATGVVIGETATLGERCTILHGVTLGSTGRPEPGLARHPQIGDDVVLGTGSTVLGNIHVGARTVIAGGAIVTKPVGEGKTVVGINKVLDQSLADGADVTSGEPLKFDI